MENNQPEVGAILLLVIFIISVLLVVIFVFVILLTQRRPQTTTPPLSSPTPFSVVEQSPTVTPTITPIKDKAISPKIHRVLTIGFNPVENGRSYADEYFQYQMGGSAESAEQKVWSDTKNAFSKVTKGSFQFEIVKSIKISSPYTYPDGFSCSLSSYSQCTSSFNHATCEARKYQFDYIAWIKQQRICEIAKEAQADEIWMLSLPYILAWENFMIGPSVGFSVNWPSFVIDSCDKHYIVVNGTYDRPTNMLHNVGHRVEDTMNYLTQTWTAADKEKYWGRFTKTCGSTHVPHNTTTAYDYGNVSTSVSNCIDWANFPEFTGTSESINCQRWGCSDAGWQEFWLSHLPKKSGETQMTSIGGKKFSFPNNWWGLLLSPDEAIAKRKEM